jgi:hypothetical protein
MINKPTTREKIFSIIALVKIYINYSFARVNLINIPVIFLLTLASSLSVYGSAYLIQSSKQETVVQGGGSLTDFTLPPKELYQNKDYVKGRLVNLKTNSPICFADISSSDKTSFTKSNSKGEYQLFSLKFPATLKIRKFGFKEETVILNHPDDSVLISLTPLEIHKNNFNNKTPVHFGLVLKKALEKFRINNDSEYPDPSQRELVYYRITSSVDSTINSLFESYAHMNVNKYSLQGYQSDIVRYASTRDYIPGLAENRLEFKIDPFINLPMFIEGYINRIGFFDQDGNQIALVGVNLGETKNVYYINIADTSIVYITSRFKSRSKNRIQGSLPAWQDDRSSSTEISFSPDIENRNSYLIDYISENEDFRLIQKNQPDQIISKSTTFAVIPDSSLLIML